MKQALLCAIAGLAAWLPAAIGSADEAAAKLLTRKHVSFEPAYGQALDLPFELVEAADVSIAIYTGDRDLIRSLQAKDKLSAGRHVLHWDGRDDLGNVVPDEAYYPVLTTRVAGVSRSYDPSVDSGGVVLERLETELSTDGTVVYRVPAPARVLVRVGIKGGAMMRALETWTPKVEGRAQVNWDGYDASHAVKLLGRPGLTVLVTGFTLPDHTIVTRGAKGIDYFEYRAQRGWKLPLVELKNLELERGGRRISRQASLPRSALRDPTVSLRAVAEAKTDAQGRVRVGGPITFRVDIPQQDKWLLQQSLYEVGFFLDQQFVSEEETGFTPLSWRWLPSDLSPGPHTMTVNVSGLWGQVGVASIGLIVERKK